MATERIRAHIERLLDEIDEALTQRKWQEVQHLASEILDLDETNEDATTFLRMAERRLGTSDVPVATANESSEAPVPLTEPSLPAPKKDPTTFGDGRYEVKRFLGEGGKKMVYLAHDDTLDRDVAFALIKTEGLDSVGLTRISREAQAMGRLGSHPHIVTVFDLGDHEGQPYMVTELMGGGDVEGIIEDAPDNRLSLDQCVNIAIETCRGLEFAHSKGIVHRDLKPGNVWLTADGIAKIGDFGLAVTSDRSRLTQEGMMVGTVSYMPPEQAMGGDVTQRADLYSLGAMMYEMVTGRPPFLGDDSIAIIGQHINTPPVAPTWHNAGCPKPLEALILRLLAKNPDERPESASDVLTVMERLELPRSGEQPSATVSSASTEEESNVLDGVASGIFVGRQQEMGDLKAALEDVLSGRGKMVTLVGEPGIGKTRTSQELATYAGLRGAKVLWGRCYEEQGVPPYWPWVQAIRTYVRDEEPQKLSTEMGAGAADISEVVPDVRTQLPGLPQSTQLEPEQARFRLFDAITAFLRSASQSRPLVIVLDDLHWADKPSLLLLQFIARELDNSRLMIVGTYRDMELSRQHPLSESLGELTRERAFQRVLLRGLSQNDVSRFIEVAAGVDPDQGLVNAVYTQTEGNPLFVTEVVRLLVQEGQLNQASNLNTAGRQTESWTVRIPEGVREVIGRRLNKLTERCNETLTVASIVGREFEFDQLKTLVDDLSDDMLLDVLEEALSARVIEEMPDSIGRYQFTHALLQETLMDELSLTRRVRLHARIAESLEALYGDQAEEHATELVFHFEQAQAMLGTEKLINYSVIAGNRALANSAFEDALNHFENCMSIASEGEIDQKGAEILVGYGKAGVSIGDPVRTRSEFVPSLERAFIYFKDSDQRENALSVADFPHSTLVQTLMKPVQQMALDMVEPDSLEAAKILSILGYSLGMTETDIQPSRDAFEKALKIARQADDRALVVRILANYANILAFFRQWDDAFVMAMEVIDREEDSRDPVDSLRALLWAANSSTQTGQLEKAYSLAQQMMGRAERRRDNYWLGRAYTALLEVQTANGNFPEVIRLGTAAAERGITDTHVTTLCIAAKMQIGMDHKEFVSMLEPLLGSNRTISPTKGASILTGVNALVFASIPILQAGIDAKHIVEYLKSFISAYLDQDGQLVQYQLPLWERMVRFVSGHYAVYTENIDLAASQYKRMTELPGPSSDFFLGAERTCLMGEISALLGDVDGADLNFSQSLVNCRDKGWKPSLAWTLFKYADFLLKRDDEGGRDKAGPMLDEALKLATDMGMEPLMQSVLSKREILKA